FGDWFVRPGHDRQSRRRLFLLAEYPSNGTADFANPIRHGELGRSRVMRLDEQVFESVFLTKLVGDADRNAYWTALFAKHAARHDVHPGLNSIVRRDGMLRAVAGAAFRRKHRKRIDLLYARPDQSNLHDLNWTNSRIAYLAFETDLRD